MSIDIRKKLEAERDALQAELATAPDRELLKKAESLMSLKAQEARVVLNAIGYEPTDEELDKIGEAMLAHTVSVLERSQSANGISRFKSAFKG